MKRLRTDTKGAVIVEFAAVILVMLSAFFSLVQISLVYTANLLLNHAAVAGVRAYAVIHKEGENNPGKNGGETDYQDAALMALGPWKDTIHITSFTANSQSNDQADYGYYEEDHVELQAIYDCNVPLGNRLVCGAGKTTVLTRIVKAQADYPHQGARYKEAP